MKQGDIVLIWGASGGLGSYATQLALNGGATPVCVVSSPEKAEICRRMGAELVIDRAAEGFKFWKDEHTQDTDEWRRFGERIRELTGGEDPDIVFEHPGRETFGVSVYVAKRGGTIVTCASTSGFHAPVRQPVPLDEPQAHRRQPLRQLPRGVGGQPADRPGARSIRRCRRPTRWSETGQAAYEVHRNAHQGKVGVLCLAPARGPRRPRRGEAGPAHRRDQPFRGQLDRGSSATRRR